MKRSKLFTIIFASLFFVFAFLAFRSVPMNQSEKDCVKITATITSISEAGTLDVLFSIKESNQKFYINRGLENGLDLKELKTKLLNKEVQFFYPKYWTILDPKNNIRHLAKVVYNEEVIFSELV